jgi:hypothetical protein
VLKSIAVFGVLALAAQGASTSLAAQTGSTVTSAELESAVLAAPATNQAAVRHFLEDAQVTEVARRMGVQAADLATSVGMLDEATLSQVADRTRAAERNLAGGRNDTVVISTTAIIIGLLILILLLK